jgi:solute carrier family 25, member 38
MSKSDIKNKPVVHLSAGAVSALTTCLALQPLDLVKTRLQQSSRLGQKSSLSILSLWNTIIKENGWRALWRGTLPTILRNVPGSSMYFATLNIIRRGLSMTSGNENLGNISTLVKLSHFNNLIAGSSARVLVGLIVMPVTVVKSRYESTFYNYNSLGSAFSHIVKNEGVKGLFAGFGSTTLRDAPYAGVYMVLYEWGKLILEGILIPIPCNQT